MAMLGERSAVVRTLWDRLTPLPFGKTLFNKALSTMVPYTGSIGPEVELLEPGHSRVAIADRRAVRNHLGSIHAMAIGNLVELTGSLSVVYGLPGDARMIITAVTLEFLKKARGRIVAEARTEPVTTAEKRTIVVAVSVRDEKDVEVAKGTVTVMTGPQRG